MDIKSTVRGASLAISKAGGRPLLVARKYSPEILTGVGIVAGVGATVVAARQTLHLEDRLEQMRHEIDLVKEKQLEHDDEGHPLHDPSEIQKDLTKAYLRGTGRIVKLYLPVITLTAISVGSILAAHGIMHKRNVALLAAYKLVEENYDTYRERVREKLGEDADLDFLTDADNKTEKDKETGEVKTVSTINPTKLKSNYGRFFDESNINFKKNAEYNLIWLRGHEAFFNEMLKARGHVFLNEVYDALGYERTGAGSVVGWIMGGEGDNYIDFGIYNVDNERARAFVNGDERAVFLDFNVDGTIWDKIDGPRSK
jgi:hypothetical protein